MYPKLFEIPIGSGLPINSYGFAIMVGFLLAMYIGVRRGKQLGIRPDLILDVGIVSMIAGIIGAKLNHIFQYPEQFSGGPQGSSFRLLDFGDGGLSTWGALIAGPLPWLCFHLLTSKDELVKRGGYALLLGGAGFLGFHIYSCVRSEQGVRGQIGWLTLAGFVLLALLLGFGVARASRSERTKGFGTVWLLMVGATVFSALIGARLFFLARHTSDYNWSLALEWQSGFVLYGGLITAIVVGALHVKLAGESIAKVADLAAPLVMLGLAFGRIGCFLNGCCHGGISKAFCAVRFPPGSPPFVEQDRAHQLPPGATHSEPVLPTQLFEAAAVLGLFFALTWYDRKKKKHPGETILAMGIGYSAWRFIVEFLRDDPRPRWLGDLTYSQTLSIAFFILCGVWLFLMRAKAAMPPAAPAVPKSS